MSKWVNRDVRGVMGSRGTPGGSREIRGVVKVSQGVKRGVRGVPGVKGCQGIKRDYDGRCDGMVREKYKSFNNLLNECSDGWGLDMKS